MQGEPSGKTGIIESTVSPMSGVPPRGCAVHTELSCSNVQRKGLVKVLLRLLERVLAWRVEPKNILCVHYHYIGMLHMSHFCAPVCPQGLGDGACSCECSTRGLRVVG